MSADQLPFCFWKSETVLGTFLSHDLRDIQLYSINTGRSLVFWGDGKHDRIAAFTNNALTNSHIYTSTLPASAMYLVQFTPQQKTTYLYASSQYVSGYNINWRATLNLDGCRNLQNLQLIDLPLTDITFDNISKLQSLSVAYYATATNSNVYKIKNLNIDNAVQLSTLGLYMTNISGMDFSKNESVVTFDSYQNNIATITFNVTGNNTLENLLANGVNTLSIDTSKIPNIYELELTGIIDQGLSLAPLNNMQIFSCAATNTMPISSMFAELPVDATRENKLAIQFLNQQSTSLNDALYLGGQWGNIYALDIRGSNISHMDTQKDEGGGVTDNALYKTRYINVNNSNLTTNATAEIIVATDRGTAGNYPQYTGALVIGDRAYDTTWVDPYGYLGSIDVVQSLRDLAISHWIISANNETVYSTDIGNSYYYNTFTVSGPYSTLSNTDFIINGVTNPVEPVDPDGIGTNMTTGVIVGENQNGNRQWQTDYIHGTNNIIMNNTNGNFILPILSYNPGDASTVGTAPTTFNLWVDSNGYGPQNGVVEGDYRLSFSDGYVTISSLFQKVSSHINGQLFRNEDNMQRHVHNITWNLYEMQSGSAVSIANGTYVPGDTDPTPTIPFADATITDVTTAPDGFKYLQVTVY